MFVFCVSLAFSGGGGQARTGTTAQGSQVLNIACFEGGYGRTYWEDMVTQFEAAHPGVKVNMVIDPEIGQILSPQTAAGEWPDFIYMAVGEHSGLVASMIKNREFLDITDVFESEVLDRPGTKLKDIILAGTLTSSYCAPYEDGKIYLAPFNTGPYGLVYNKALFEQKGWKLPRTWDEFFAVNEELKKPANFVEIDGKRVQRSLFTYQGIYSSYLEMLLWPAVAGAGGLGAIADILTYKPGSFDIPAVRSVLENFVKIGTQGYLMEGTVALNHTQSQADMMMGKALFIPNGTWMEGEMADSPREPGFTFGMVAAPTIRAGQDNYVLSSLEEFFIPKQAKNPALAKEFIKFLYTRPSIESFAKNANGVYAVKDAQEIGKPYLSSGTYGMFSIYNNGGIFMLMDFEALPANTKVDIKHVIFEDNMNLLITGRISVNEYIKRIEDAFAEITADKARAN
jgi:N-acetylglucosamine transport system substrate-binding protein